MGIFSENGHDGQDIAGRQADRGPQHWGAGFFYRDGGPPAPFSLLHLLTRYMLPRGDASMTPGFSERGLSITCVSLLLRDYCPLNNNDGGQRM